MRQFGRLEVTFAWDEPGRAKPPASEMDEIRQQLFQLRAAMGQANGEAPESPSFARLRAAGMSREMAGEIDEAVGRMSGDPHRAVVQELTRRIAVAPLAEMKPGETRTMVFIGPPGSGKTTSLVKAAMALGLVPRIPVRIYSVGEHAIGGQEQIARYAAILGVPCQAYESLESLHLALNGDQWKGLILIDTPGLAAGDAKELAEFGRFLGGRAEMEKHLVLRADTRSADMLHMVSRFAGLQPSRLLFTGMDEAVSVGPMVDVLMRAGIPATFAGTGQRIPDDLEEVDAARLAGAVWIAGGLGNRDGQRIRLAAAAA
jgi:flagellar biosynthesis protein FlhF